MILLANTTHKCHLNKIFIHHRTHHSHQKILPPCAQYHQDKPEDINKINYIESKSLLNKSKNQNSKPLKLTFDDKDVYYGPKTASEIKTEAISSPMPLDKISDFPIRYYLL